MLNIAEGSGRFTDKNKRNFYVIARGSAFECVAVFDFLKDEGVFYFTALGLERLSDCLLSLSQQTKQKHNSHNPCNNNKDPVFFNGEPNQR